VSIKEFSKLVPYAGMLALIIGAASVDPDVATSNLAKWAGKLWLTNLPTWLTNTIFDHRVIVWGPVILIIYVVIIWWVIPYFKIRNINKFIPMREATTRAYTQLRKHKSIWSDVADKFFGSSLGNTREEGVLIYLANAFTTQNIPLYGKHPPSLERELISPLEFGRGRFTDGGATFYYHGRPDPEYADIAIKESDLEGVIEKMKRDSSLAF